LLYRQAVGAQTESATPFDNRGLRSKRLVAGAGFEPKGPSPSKTTESEQNFAKSLQNNALPDSSASPSEQKRALPEQTKDTSARQEHVPSMYADLAEVEAAWPRLPAAVKAEILDAVRKALSAP
jgi:hypothetical protein